MILEFFAFGGDISVPVFALMPAASTSLIALQHYDPIGYEICMNAIADLVGHIMRFMDNDVSKPVPLEVVYWWTASMTATLSVTLQKIRLEFFKGYPHSWVCLGSVHSSRV